MTPVPAGTDRPAVDLRFWRKDELIAEIERLHILARETWQEHEDENGERWLAPNPSGVVRLRDYLAAVSSSPATTETSET